MQFFYLSVIYSFIYPQRLYSTRSLLGRLSIRVDKRGSWASWDSRGLVFQIETVETRTGSLELAQFLPPLLGCNWLERISRTFKGYCFISTIASIHLPWFFFLSNYFRPAIFHVETSRKKKKKIVTIRITKQSKNNRYPSSSRYRYLIHTICWNSISSTVS